MTSPCLLSLSLDRKDEKDIWHTQGCICEHCSENPLFFSWQQFWAKPYGPGYMAEVTLPSWNNKSRDDTSSKNNSVERSGGGSASFARRPACDMEHHSQTKGGRRDEDRRAVGITWNTLLTRYVTCCQKTAPPLPSCNEPGKPISVCVYVCQVLSSYL